MARSRDLSRIVKDIDGADPLNAKASQIDCYYTSRLPGEAADASSIFIYSGSEHIKPT